MAKLKLEVDGLNELVERLSKVGADTKSIAEKALKESHAYVTTNIHNAMSKHHRTGRTEGAIVDSPKVDWVGTLASIEIGFDISNGGLASIFLMYGTPRMRKDQELYNSVWGKATTTAITQIQENVLYDALRELGG